MHARSNTGFDQKLGDFKASALVLGFRVVESGLVDTLRLPPLATT